MINNTKMNITYSPREAKVINSVQNKTAMSSISSAVCCLPSHP